MGRSGPTTMCWLVPMLPNSRGLTYPVHEGDVTGHTEAARPRATSLPNAIAFVSKIWMEVTGPKTSSTTMASS